MTVKNKITTVDEQSSIDISFDCFEADGITEINPSAVTVEVFITGSNPLVYVNLRDGGPTHQTGLSLVTHAVAFHMAPADNEIVNASLYGSYGYEYHTVRFKVVYNVSVDTEWVEYALKVRNLPGVPSA